jgi:hypothetical protein
MFWGFEQVKLLRSILDELRVLRRDLRFVSSRPGVMRLLFVREDGKMSFCVITLPPTTAPDTVLRELIVTVASGDPVTLNPPVGADRTEEFECVQGDAVHAELVDIDDGVPPNRSEVSTLDATVLDNQAPPKPGQMGLLMTRE